MQVQTNDNVMLCLKCPVILANCNIDPEKRILVFDPCVKSPAQANHRAIIRENIASKNPDTVFTGRLNQAAKQNCPQTPALIGIHDGNGELGDVRFVRQAYVAGETCTGMIVIVFLNGTPGQPVPVIEAGQIIQLVV